MAKISIDLKSGSVTKKEVIVGIDLGTTNSLVAVIDEETGKPFCLAAADKNTIVPSLVFFDKEHGEIVGEGARPYLLSHPQQTVYSAKRLMGKSYADLQSETGFFSYPVYESKDERLVRVKINERFYTPIELSAFILKELKQRAERYLDAAVKKAVITVPAYFNDVQRQATRDAGKLAGLEVLRIVNEPTAASLAYGMGAGNSLDKIIAVYDLGGGTFDVSVLRIQHGIYEVLATNGDTYLGGDDLDNAVVKYWLETYWKDATSELQDLLKKSLRILAEKARRVLSAEDNFRYAGNFNGVEGPLELNKTTLESLITPILQRTLKCCAQALEDAQLKASDIEEVVMVGGTTRTPLVKKLVKDFFLQAHFNDTLNPDEVVALGAAIEADILAGNRKDMLLLDVTPLSLGIETMGGLMDVMIPRNNKVPSSVAKQYTTSIDGQVNLKINVYQGERELVSQNRKLAEFDLKGIPAMPAGLPKIQVKFMLNTDGILKIEAEELRSGTKQEVEVRPQYGLTDAEIEKMLLDSVTHAAEDIRTRMLFEAATEARQLIYTTERFMEKNRELLQDSEIEETRKLIVHLQETLREENKDNILAAVEQLNEYTRPFAERVMDEAVARALKGKTIE